MARRFKSLEQYMESLYDEEGYYSTIPAMKFSEYTMPDINLNEDSWKQRCFRCNKAGFTDWNNVGADIGLKERDIHDEYFRGRPYHKWMHQMYCNKCYELIRPYILKIVDIFELDYYAGFLYGCISDKRRAKNNGRASNDACERRKRRLEWGLGNRPSSRDSQACEEYKRFLVLRDENRNVLERDTA